MKTAAELAQARAAANAVRGDYLAAVRNGYTTPAEVIEQATLEGFEPLKAIRLTTLFSAQPGVGETKSNRIVSCLTGSLGLSSVKKSKITIAWLVDKRACGRRLIALSNVVRDTDSPWPGFPLTPKPEKRK